MFLDRRVCHALQVATIQHSPRLVQRLAWHVLEGRLLLAVRLFAHALPDMFHLARPGRTATLVLWATAPSPMAVRYARQVPTKELRVRLHALLVALARSLLRGRLLASRAHCTRMLPAPGQRRALLVLQAPPPPAPELQPVPSAMPERTARPAAQHARPAQLARSRRLVHPLARHVLQAPTL